MDDDAYVPPHAVSVRCQQHTMYSTLDCAYGDNVRHWNAGLWLTMVASVMQGLHQRMMPLLHNHYTSSLTYQLGCK